MAAIDPARPMERVIAKRLCLAGLSACVILLFFYWVGNQQEFLDSSLLLLLSILAWASPMVALCSLAGLAIVLARPRASERLARRALGMLGYFIAMIACVSIYLLSIFLMSILRGE